MATRNFYLDPTHLRPIPPELLAFLPEYYGFVRSKIVRLQESRDLDQREKLSLQDVLGGVSPDYAVVAQKKAAANVLALFDQAFNQNYGLALDTLASRYDAGINKTEATVHDVGVDVEHTRSIAQQVHAELPEVRAAIQEVRSVAQQAVEQITEVKAKIIQAEQEARDAQETIRQIHCSRSWRVTAPLRWASWQLKLLRQFGLTARAKAFVKKILRKVHSSIDARPVLRRRVIAVLRRVGLLSYIKSIYLHKLRTETGSGLMAYGPHNAADLTPRAQSIYKTLQAARERKKGVR